MSVNEVEKTDYRRCSSQVLYEARKTVIRMRKNKKSVEEIAEATGLSKNVIYITIRSYKAGSNSALKPKKRGRKKGTNKTLTQDQETKIQTMIVDKNPDQLKMK